MAHSVERQLRISDVAAHVHVSEPTLQTLFREELGISAGEYFTRLRVARARDWLRATDASVTDVAMTLGFSSSQYFATVFRKYTGMSPTTYRQRREVGAN